MPAAVLVTFALWSIACVGFFGWLLGAVVAAVSWLTVLFLLGAVTTRLETGSWHFGSQSGKPPSKVLIKSQWLEAVSMLRPLFSFYGRVNRARFWGITALGVALALVAVVSRVSTVDPEIDRS
jgi:hypothetical protein